MVLRTVLLSGSMTSPTIAMPPPDAAVRAMLTELGLSHLIAVFAEHEVDDAAYLQLQDADLRDISISRGNRRKILTAIQAISGEDLPDPDHMIPSPPYEPLPMPFYVPTVPVHPPPMVLGPIAPGSIPWSYYAPPPPPDTIFQGTVIDFKSEATVKRRYGIIRVDHTHNLVFLSPQDAPDGYVSDGDRCEFRIVEYKNQKNRKLEGTRLQWKAVDVVCVQRAAPQPSC